MSFVESMGSSELPSFGPPDSWSIDHQLEWVMENTTVERSPAELPDEAPETPGVEIEILDGDGAEEGAGIRGWHPVLPCARRYAC